MSTDLTRAAPAEKQLRILVVEDNHDVARSQVLLLRALGHEAFIAHDGLSALELAERHTPDVILLDIGIPGLDGWQVAGELRKKHYAKRPLLVAVTGYGSQEDTEKSTAAGIDLHLLKPVLPDDLERLLERFGRIIHG